MLLMSSTVLKGATRHDLPGNVALHVGFEPLRERCTVCANFSRRKFQRCILFHQNIKFSQPVVACQETDGMGLTAPHLEYYCTTSQEWCCFCVLEKVLEDQRNGDTQGTDRLQYRSDQYSYLICGRSDDSFIRHPCLLDVSQGFLHHMKLK